MTEIASTASVKWIAWDHPASVYHQLVGSWRFRRTISPHATMAGEAIFAPDGSGALSYREHGVLALASDQSLEAERRYLYRGTDEGFSVVFAEPPFALFQTIALAPEGDGFVGRARHRCADDLYVSEYRFGRGGDFSIQHTVRGPRKDYVSLTMFERNQLSETPMTDRFDDQKS